MCAAPVGRGGGPGSNTTVLAASELRAAWPLELSKRAALGWILLATLAAVLLRVPRLDQEITHDEAFSWLGYAVESYEQIFTTYHQPNNHILHTALMRLSSQVFDGHDEWMLRAPAFVSGVATVPATAGLVAAALGSPTAGVVAAWHLALHPSHVSYSTSARGYSSLVLWTTLAWWSALIAQRGRRWFWLGFGAAGLLATWTLPSGGLFLLSLGGWSAWRARKDHGAGNGAFAAGTVLTASLASLAAYGYVLDDLLTASERWGTKVWADPVASLRTLASGFTLLLGGGAVVAIVSSAVLGAIRLAQRCGGLAVQVAVVAMFPILVAVVSGMAGPGRSYFYLLPATSILVAVWVVDSNTHVRRLGAVLCAGALALSGWSLLHFQSRDHGFEALAQAFDARSGREALIAPLFVDVPLDLYTGDAEKHGLLRVLEEGVLDALLFVWLDTDPRAQFSNYALTDSDSLYHLQMPEKPFDEVYRGGDMRLLALTNGSRVYPRQGTKWQITSGQADLRWYTPAFGSEPAMRIDSDRAGFTLIEKTRFASNWEGLMAITYAGRLGVAGPSLCEETESSWKPGVSHSGQTRPMAATDAAGHSWTLENRLVVVKPGVYYALCITGTGGGERYVSDLVYTYFPLVSD
ncbi:MAG: hypothetical protein CME04_06060 [Gemmatimonadaceae bacterium]|nr:hypothetical protein [Gemmatimonadaceae bacterium]